MVAACKVRRKLFVAEIFNNEGDESNVLGANDYYQEDESLGTHNVILEKQTQSSRNGSTSRRSLERVTAFEDDGDYQLQAVDANNTALGTVVGAQSSKLSTLPVNKLIVLYVVFKLDESYTPSKVSILAGDGFHNLKEIKTVELVKPTG
ncbi:hypothetical protein JHK82_016089 [Glycine max]|nr:hypothetical protein JHK85_016487 [Glycine max]KAG5046710.1 hypothetical protein JHK86_016116 [Glycine max]KAG5149208.1 hypothetical protein JHK82_016089 [Glycine max]